MRKRKKIIFAGSWLVGFLGLLFILSLSTTASAKFVTRPQDRAIFHNNQGVGFLTQQQIDKAIFEFKTAIEISPEYAEAWHNLGLGYKFKRDYKASIDALNRAVKIDDKYSGAWTALGTVYNTTGEYQKAIPCFKKALDPNNKYADAYYNMGVSYRSLGQIDRAIENFRKATEANQNHYFASIELGTIYLSQEKLEEALIRCKVAVETNPNGTEGWLCLAQVFQKQGNSSKAQEAINRAIASQPNSAEAHLALGMHYLNEKNWGLSKIEFEKAQAIGGENSDTLYHLSLLDLGLGDQARERGEIDKSNSFYKKALSGLQKSAESRQNADIAFNLAYTFYKTGDQASAQNWFSKALQMNPNHYKAMFAYGILLGETGKTEEAKRVLCRFVKNAPEEFSKEKQSAQTVVGSCR